MKARYITAKEKKIATQVAEDLIDKAADDIKKRAECLVYAAMLNAGLAVSTVNRVIKHQEETEQGYARARLDKLGDYALIQGLIDRGVNVTMTKEEI